MTLLAWLIGLILPACAGAGAAGLTQPPLMDLSHIERPASPNTALAGPAGTEPRPDTITPFYPVSAQHLFATVIAVASGEPRTFLAAAYPPALQAHFVARSAVFNFPDLIAVQVLAAGPGQSALVLYSRSVYGYADFGVNRRRVDAWLAGVQTTINRMNER